MHPDSADEDRTSGSGRRRVDTGGLPSRAELTRLLAEAHRRFADRDDGACSTVYPRCERLIRACSAWRWSGRTVPS
jgi:hypothetical protein